MNFLCYQIENIFKYNPECYIVIHLSQNFGNVNLPFQHPQVIVNPERCPTEWGFMWHAQFSNLSLIRRIEVDYSYIVFEASNTLYFKSKSAQYMSQFDAGFTTRTVQSHWNEAIENTIKSDSTFMSMVGTHKLVTSNHEGTFYKKEIIEQIHLLLALKYNMPQHYLPGPQSLSYNIEEVWFPNICLTFTEKIGLPLTMVTSLLRPLSWNSHFNIYGESPISREKFMEFKKDENNPPFAIKGFHRNLDDGIVKWILSMID